MKNLINYAGALTDYARGFKQSQTEEEENECLQFKKHRNCTLITHLREGFWYTECAHPTLAKMLNYPPPLPSPSSPRPLFEPASQQSSG